MDLTIILVRNMTLRSTVNIVKKQTSKPLDVLRLSNLSSVELTRFKFRLFCHTLEKQKNYRKKSMLSLLTNISVYLI